MLKVNKTIKIVASLLIFLQAEVASASLGDKYSLGVGYTLLTNLPCTLCLDDEETNIIADRLETCEIIEYERDRYVELVNKRIDDPWYKDPTYQIAGYTVSFALGAGVAAYIIHRTRK